MLTSWISGCEYISATMHLPAGYETTLEPQGRSLTVPTFIDKRPFTHRIGLKRDFRGADTANVAADGDVNEWVSLQVKRALTAKGFQVVELSKNPEVVRIQGETLRVFIEQVLKKWSYQLEADLSVRIRVSRSDGLEAQRRYYVKAVKPADFLFQTSSSTSDYEQVLQDATRMLMSRITADIVALLNRYPDQQPDGEGGK